MRPSESTVDRDLFPDVPEERRPRRIYLQNYSELDAEWLRLKGYEPVALITLPRNTQAQQIEYLLAKAQGIEEGTISVSTAQRLMLVTEMQAFGLLNKQNQNLNIDVKVGDATVQDLLSWGASRHTLRGDNTTIQDLVRTKILPAEILETQDSLKAVQKARKGKR